MEDLVANIVNSTDVFIPIVKELSELSLPGNVPNIQFTSQSIDIETRADATTFMEKGDFESCFSQEMEQISKIELMTEQGDKFVHMLYTFRSVSRAIPMVSITAPEGASADVEEEMEIRREELNRKIVEIFRPEILKLKELMIFIGNFVSSFCGCVQYMSSPEARNKVIPEGVYEAFIKAVDLMVKIDHLKDQKASLNNDFTRYKRSISQQSKAGNRISGGNYNQCFSCTCKMLILSSDDNFLICRF